MSLLEVAAQNIAKESTAGVYKLTHDKSTYWVKVCGEDKSNFVRALSTKIAKLESLSYLRSNAALDTKVRFNHEKTTIQYLYQEGLNVPHILVDAEDFFVTPNAGVSLDRAPKEYFEGELLNTLFSQFGEMHNRDIVHGRPAMRDILVNEQQHITLVDFEESVLSANSQLKARDIFLLLMDLCRIEHLTKKQKIQAVELWKNIVSEADWQALQKMCRTLSHFQFVAQLVLKFKPRNRTSNQILSTLSLLRERA
jgi:tRNA A-37 threonylcarbamoyl transferase component Bud32